MQSETKTLASDAIFFASEASFYALDGTFFASDASSYALDASFFASEASSDALEMVFLMKDGATVTSATAIITARGFDVVSAGAPVMMGLVTGMMATSGDGERKVDWMCDPQKGAFYLLQTSPDVMPRVWTNQEPSKKSSGTLSGQTSLTRLWVRAAAKGANNTGGWSDPALANVP